MEPFLPLALTISEERKPLGVTKGRARVQTHSHPCLLELLTWPPPLQVQPPIPSQATPVASPGSLPRSGDLVNPVGLVWADLDSDLEACTGSHSFPRMPVAPVDAKGRAQACGRGCWAHPCALLLFSRCPGTAVAQPIWLKLGSLPPIGKTWMEFQVPGFALGRPWLAVNM